MVNVCGYHCGQTEKRAYQRPPPHQPKVILKAQMESATVCGDIAPSSGDPGSRDGQVATKVRLRKIRVR